MYLYPNNKVIKVTEDTLTITPLTFSRDGTYYEPQSVEYFFSLVNKKDISGTKNIVDIGAQSGLYSLYAKYIENGYMYSFEPNPETYALLMKNIELNEITNIHPENKGLGATPENLILRVPLRGEEKGLCCLGKTPLRFSEWEEKTVEVTTLDKEFFEKNIPVHFIKCDSEGWEVNILKGGLKTIEKWSPDLFFEVNDTNLCQCGTNREELMKIINTLGYILVTIYNDENYHFTKKRD
jgi:FkbM family methyltransferase